MMKLEAHSLEATSAVPFLHKTRALLFFGLLIYAISQWLAFSTRIAPQNISIFWPPAGVMLALLAVTPRARVVWMGAGLATMAFLCNAIAGRPLGFNLMLVANDITVGVLGAWLYRSWIGTNHPVYSVKTFGLFLLVVLISALVSASVGSLIVNATYGASMISIWHHWLSAIVLGILVAVPFLVWFSKDAMSQPLFNLELGFWAVLLISLVLLGIAHFQETTSVSLRLAAMLLAVPLLLWTAVRRTAFEASALLSLLTIAKIYALAGNWWPLSLAIVPEGVTWVMAIFAIQGGAVFLLAANHHEQKRVERNLSVEAARLKSAIDASNDGIVSTNNKGIIETFSPAAERLFGYAAKEVIGENVRILMPDSYAVEHDGYMDHHLKTGEKRIIGIGRLVTGKRKDGTEFPMELSIGEAFSQSKHVFTGFIRDVSERQQTEQRMRELQEEILHVSRLSAMGELASALAHELNQPLTAIRNYAQTADILLKKGKDPAQLPGLMQKTAEQAGRAGDIIKRLRGFVTARQVEKSPQKVSQLIEEACALGLIGAREDGVNARLLHGKNLPELFVDRIQIQQILVNLVRNAVDAVRNAPVREIIVRSRSDETHVAIEVVDSGLGVSETAEANLFKPFMTTKAAGMGIGLSLSRSIAETHGGTLTYAKNPAGGAIFVLSLPIGAPADEDGHPGK